MINTTRERRGRSKEAPPSLSPLSSSGSGRRAKERQEGKEGKKEGMKEGKKKRQLYCVHRREKQPFRLL